MKPKQPHIPPLNIRPSRKHEGYVYVVGFCTSRIKVGQTTVPRIRIRDHATAAETYSRTLTHAWVSRPHVNHVENEEILLEYVRSWARPAMGREYFDGLDFEQISYFASGLWLCRWNDDYRNDPVWQRIVGERRYVRRLNESLDEWHERMAILVVTAM
jgi:hypothetical protein